MTQQNTHPTPETLDAYVAGGIPDADRDAVASHLALCPACSAFVADATELDRSMHQTLSSLGPAAGFDDRLAAAVRSFATPRPPLRISPPVRRAAIAAAAVLMVGVAGYAGSVGMDGGFNRQFANKVPSASNLHQIGLATKLAQSAGHDGDFSTADDRVFNFEPFDSEEKSGAADRRSYAAAKLSKSVNKLGPSAVSGTLSLAPTSPEDSNDSVLLPGVGSATKSPSGRQVGDGSSRVWVQTVPWTVLPYRSELNSYHAS